MSPIARASRLPEREEVCSIEDYRRVAEDAFPAEADGYFTIWPTQLEIHRACETLAARLRHSTEAVDVGACTDWTARVAAAWRQRPGTTKFDSAMISFLTRCATFVAAPVGIVAHPSGLTALAALLTDTVRWSHPTEVRVQHAIAFNSLFALDPADWRTGGDRYEKARDLAKLTQKVSSVRNINTVVASAVAAPLAPAQPRATSAGVAERFQVCVAWKPRGFKEPRIDMIGPVCGIDENSALHELGGLTGYNLQHTWNRRRTWKTRENEKSIRWTTILLRRWLEQALTKTVRDDSLQQVLKKALARLNHARAEVANDPRDTFEIPIVLLWRRGNIERPVKGTKQEVEHLWAMLKILRASYDNDAVKGRVNRALWSTAMREVHGFDYLEPHECWRRGL